MDTAERRRQLRDALISAAEDMIASRGLAALKARNLAKEAGCALGAIYNVFPDLDALVLAVNSRTLALLDRELRSAPPDQEGSSSQPPAVTRLVQLAITYLDFAAAHPLRWRAVFEHRMPEGQTVPDWHLEDQRRLFSYIEAPLREIQPDMQEPDRALLARSLFSAVHGIVSLGLEEKLGAVPLPRLREQVAFVIAAAARGMLEAAPSAATIRGHPSAGDWDSKALESG